MPEFPSLLTSPLSLCLSLALSSPLSLHSAVILPMRPQASEQLMEVSFFLRCWAVSSHREQMTSVSALPLSRVPAWVLHLIHMIVPQQM